jgi:hypothetical protein
MKEADAILWVVADQEPSAEARRDLSILAEYSHTVVPVLNVIEDPEAVPPLRRNDERVREIAEILMREFRTYFSPEIEGPLLVSARVIEIERARPRPAPEVLREAGLDALMELLERMFLAHQEGRTQGRRYRLCGAATAVVDKAQAYLAGVLETIGRKEELAEVRLGDAERRVAEIEILNDDLRGSIRTMAQATAATVCDRISRMAATFVEDQLQLVQFNNLRRSITARSRELLAADLQRRFLGPQYLKLDRSPHWLDGLNADYAEQVRSVVVAQWSRLGRIGGGQKLTLPGSSSPPLADLDRLGKDLQQTIVAVLGKVLGVAGFTGALALIPGGQALVALGFAGAAGLAAATNPLAERRRRAIDVVQSQILSHRHTLARELFDAGLAGGHLLSAQVRASLQTSLDEASRRRLDLVELRSRLREGDAGLALLRQGLNALQRGQEVD